MFLFLRILGAAIGAGTAAMVLLGLIAVAEFFVADLMIGAVLVGSALIPARGWAWRGLLVGHGYALGVFTVALAQQLEPQGTVNPALIGVMVATGVGLVGLLIVKPDAAIAR